MRRSIGPTTRLEVPRRLGLALLVVGVMLLTALGGCHSETPPASDTPRVIPTTMLYIRAGATDCTIQDAGGNSTVTVPRGGKVVFVNETTTDVTLLFGHNKRLFGVHEGVLYADSQQEYTVRDDATVGEHTYQSNCRATQPGPIIIVPPPGGGG